MRFGSDGVKVAIREQTERVGDNCYIVSYSLLRLFGQHSAAMTLAAAPSPPERQVKAE